MIGKRPRFSFVKVWGWEVYVKRLMSENSLQNQTNDFYNKAEGKVFVARSGVFMEKEFLSKGVSGSKVQVQEIQETPKNVSAPIDPIQEVQDVVAHVEAPAPCRSIRAHHATKKFTFLTTEQCDILLLDNDEPMTYTEAMMGPTSEKWLGAMESEIQFMHDNQVWNMVDPIDGVRPTDVNGFPRKRRTRMEMFTSIRHDWWQKALSRIMVLTMMKLSHLSRC
jgi:hypothetical protein